MFYLLMIYGLFAGYFAGFLGVGAGIFLMPLFLIIGIPYHIAVDASLMAIFFPSVVSSIQHIKTYRPPMESWMVVAVSGAITATIGSFYLIHVLPPKLLMIIFSAMLFINADLIYIMRNKKLSQIDIASINHLSYFPLYIVMGIIVGLTASLLGVGGGGIMITLLMCMASFKVKDAVRVAVIVMMFTTLFGMSEDIINNTLPYKIGFACAIGTIIGGFLGSIALKYVRQSVIVKMNYAVSIIIGIIVLIKAIIH